MVYTDREMRKFTQIAYADLTKGYEELCKKSPGKTSFTINEVKEASIEAGVPKSKLAQLDCLTNDQLSNWEIAGIHDTNSKNGFYGCVIETSPGNAAVGFRGSENMGSLDNVVNDWVGADIGLVNSTCTNQQKEVDRFLLKYQNQLNGYDTLAMSGHSLGGNLAEYATIVSGKYGLDDNISQCMSMDGPGFSDEFISKYRQEIQNMSSVMKHPRWSFVGTMLNDLPGVEYKYVKVSNEANTVDYEEYNVVTRHDTKYLEYDENDQLVCGEQDGLSKATSVISKGVDHMPPVVGTMLISTISAIWIGVMWFNENFVDVSGLTTSGWIVVSAIIGVSLVLGIGKVAMVVVSAVVAIIAVIVIATVLEVARDVIISAVEKICDTIGTFCDWTKAQISQLFNSVIETLGKLGDWWNKNFNAGYKYANSNPYLEINTSTMRTYASTLQSLSSRAKSLDRRMNSLYWQLGIDWSTIINLGKLLSAGIILDFAYRLDKCVNYLETTATDFENAEKDIMSNC